MPGARAEADLSSGPASCDFGSPGDAGGLRHGSRWLSGPASLSVPGNSLHAYQGNLNLDLWAPGWVCGSGDPGLPSCVPAGQPASRRYTALTCSSGPPASWGVSTMSSMGADKRAPSRFYPLSSTASQGPCTGHGNL